MFKIFPFYFTYYCFTKNLNRENSIEKQTSLVLYKKGKLTSYKNVNQQNKHVFIIKYSNFLIQKFFYSKCLNSVCSRKNKDECFTENIMMKFLYGSNDFEIGSFHTPKNTLNYKNHKGINIFIDVSQKVCLIFFIKIINIE